MTRYTLPEYQVAVHAHTGLLPDIIVYEDGRGETIGLWHEQVEVLQIPERAGLDQIPTHLPEGFSVTSPTFTERVRVIEALQRPSMLEKVLADLRDFRAQLESPQSTLSSLTVMREIRGRIARAVWDASPLFLKQLEQACAKGDRA